MMAYNWNNDLGGQRNNEFWMQFTLSLSVLLFALVIGSLAYFLVDFRIDARQLEPVQSAWHLRR